MVPKRPISPSLAAMKLIQAPRASSILYSLLVSQNEALPWLLPANICPIIPLVFFKARIPFEFVDVSSETLHVDLEQVEYKNTIRNYRGFLYAHTYGEPSTPLVFFAALKERFPDLIIIDDRCLCVPDLESISTADVILYSTGYAKVVELNFGGYAFISDEIQYHPARLPFNPIHHGEIEKLYKKSILMNTQFSYQDSDWLETNNLLMAWDDYSRRVESALGSSLRQRDAINRIYTSLLPKEIQLAPVYQNWRFNIRVKNKKRILKSIFDSGLFASSHYASMAGIMAGGSAPNAVVLFDEIINLFNDHHFDENKARNICSVILENL